MKVLGLTGSIGMGKSATAAMFRDRGVPVYDADAAVHEIYEPGGAGVAPVEAAFPGVIGEDGAIDRARLRARVLGRDQEISRLNAIVHPLVAGTQLQFRSDAQQAGADFVVLDIPLLFETGGDQRCDHVCVVTAPQDVQASRVLARDGMTQQAFEAILARQLPDAEKRARADFIINTAFGFEFARDMVGAISELMIRLNREPTE